MAAPCDCGGTRLEKHTLATCNHLLLITDSCNSHEGCSETSTCHDFTASASRKHQEKSKARATLRFIGLSGLVIHGQIRGGQPGTQFSQRTECPRELFDLWTQPEFAPTGLFLSLGWSSYNSAMNSLRSSVVLGLAEESSSSAALCN